MPPLVETLLGVDVSDQYDSLVTVMFMLVLFYGADYAYRTVTGAGRWLKIKAQLDGIITEIARELRISEDRVRKVLEDRYSKGVIRKLTDSVLDFFKPSKHQSNAPIAIGNRRVESEVVAEVPGDVQIQEFEDELISQPLPPHADYSDVVTDEYRARIAAAVPEEDYSDAKVESGPAW